MLMGLKSAWHEAGGVVFRRFRTRPFERLRRTFDSQRFKRRNRGCACTRGILDVSLRI